MLIPAQRFLGALQLVDKACVPNRCRGAICSHRKQLLVNLVGKIRAARRCSNETALAVYADRHHDATAECLAAAEGFDRPIVTELKAVLIVTAVVTLFFFLLPGPIVAGAKAAAAALFVR